MRGLIINNSQLSPGSLCCPGLNHQILYVTPRTLVLRYREACSYHLYPHYGGRRAQTSLFLSPVPTRWRKKGTDQLVPISCAHAKAEEGHRLACSCLLCPHYGGRRTQAGVRCITPNVRTVICERAPNHGSYFVYARLCFRKLSVYSSSFSIWLTLAGSALPFIAFMVWPTRKPMAFSLPLW